MISKYVSDRSAKVNCIGIFFFFSKNMTKKDKKRSGQCLDFFFYSIGEFYCNFFERNENQAKKNGGGDEMEENEKHRGRRHKTGGDKECGEKKKVPPSPDLPKKFNCATNK